MAARPHVTCISLRRREDRRARMNATVRPHFPQMRFFDAVDAARPRDIPREILSRMRVMPLAPETARHRKAAGWASHAAVLEGALRRNAFPHIVLEDDVEVAATARVPYASLPRDAITMLAGRITAVHFKDMRRFNESGAPRRIAAALRRGVHRIDKGRYRLTSAAAYYVPTAEVARRFLEEARARRSLTHFDCELYDSSVVTHFWFPSPFRSDVATAGASDIMPSQSTLFDTDYTPLSPHARRGDAPASPRASSPRASSPRASPRASARASSRSRSPAPRAHRALAARAPPLTARAPHQHTSMKPPTQPTERMEPTEPTERTEPTEPALSRLPTAPTDAAQPSARRETVPPTLATE